MLLGAVQAVEYTDNIADNIAVYTQDRPVVSFLTSVTLFPDTPD